MQLNSRWHLFEIRGSFRCQNCKIFLLRRPVVKYTRFCQKGTTKKIQIKSIVGRMSPILVSLESLSLACVHFESLAQLDLPQASGQGFVTPCDWSLYTRRDLHIYSSQVQDSHHTLYMVAQYYVTTIFLHIIVTNDRSNLHFCGSCFIALVVRCRRWLYKGVGWILSYPCLVLT